MKWKHEKAERDFRKYVENEFKKPCNLCGSKKEHIMCNCVSAFYCSNKKCKNNDISHIDFGECNPSVSTALTNQDDK